MALAGYIVERASGEPFTTAIDDHILRPLGMTHSTFEQPLPAEFDGVLSRSYLVGSDPPLDFEIVQAIPAGALTASAGDMARFMLAFLQGGVLDGTRILTRETVVLMLGRQVETSPALNAMGLGFAELSTNGRRIFGHAGDMAAFRSDLLLLPDEQVGVFVAVNSAGKTGWSGADEMARLLINRYFPSDEPARLRPAAALADAAAVIGSYRSSRRQETSVGVLGAILGQRVVRANNDGTIELSDVTTAHGRPKRWEEVGPLVYREVGGRGVLAFTRNAEGQVVEYATDVPVAVRQRVGWSEDKRLVLPLAQPALRSWRRRLCFGPLPV